MIKDGKQKNLRGNAFKQTQRCLKNSYAGLEWGKNNQFNWWILLVFAVPVVLVMWLMMPVGYGWESTQTTYVSEQWQSEKPQGLDQVIHLRLNAHGCGASATSNIRQKIYVYMEMALLWTLTWGTSHLEEDKWNKDWSWMLQFAGQVLHLELVCGVWWLLHWTYADVKNRATKSHNVEITVVFGAPFIVHHNNCGSLCGGFDWWGMT